MFVQASKYARRSAFHNFPFHRRFPRARSFIRSLVHSLTRGINLGRNAISSARSLRCDFALISDLYGRSRDN